MLNLSQCPVLGREATDCPFPPHLFFVLCVDMVDIPTILKNGILCCPKKGQMVTLSI